MNKQYFFNFVIILLLACSSLCPAAPSLNVEKTPLYHLLGQIKTGQAQNQAVALMQSISQQISNHAGLDKKVIEQFRSICDFVNAEDGTPIDLAHIQPHHLRTLDNKINECNAYINKHVTSATLSLFRDITQCNEIVLLSLQEAVSQQCDFLDYTLDYLFYRPMEFVTEHKVLTACCVTAVVAGFVCYYFYPTSNNNNHNNNNNNNIQPLNGRDIRGINLVQGDITRQLFDQQDQAAIVNAANTRMRGGAGIDGAIHRAAGPGLLNEERDRNLNCPVGEARLTGGHDLAPLRIIHTVGPDTRDNAQNAQRRELLDNAYQSSLNLAANNNIRYVALPSISTGIFGYPIQEAALIAVNAAIRQQQQANPLTEIRFVTFDRDTFDVYRNVLDQCQIHV